MTYNKKIYAENLNILKSWIESKGYTLLLSRCKEVVDSIDFDKRLIEVNTTTRYENRIYSILHECGHLKERSSRNYNKKYPHAKKIDQDMRHINSVIGRTQTVEEEINAWREGFKLAKKLNIQIDKEKYDIYASTNIMTYINWAATGKSKKKQQKKEVDKGSAMCYNVEEPKQKETQETIEEQLYGIF